MAPNRKKHRAAQPPDTEPWLRRLPLELRDNPKSVEWAKRQDEHEQMIETVHRAVVDFYELHRVCPRVGCRRASRCTSPKMPCYDAIHPWLRENVILKLRAELLGRPAQGMMPREES